MQPHRARVSPAGRNAHIGALDLWCCGDERTMLPVLSWTISARATLNLRMASKVSQSVLLITPGGLSMSLNSVVPRPVRRTAWNPFRHSCLQLGLSSRCPSLTSRRPPHALRPLPIEPGALSCTAGSLFSTYKLLGWPLVRSLASCTPRRTGSRATSTSTSIASFRSIGCSAVFGSELGPLAQIDTIPYVAFGVVYLS